MTFFTEERAKQTFKRTQKDLEDIGAFASRRPVAATLAAGILVLDTILFPVPVIFTLCVAALALILFNLVTEPSPGEIAGFGKSPLGF